MNVFNREMKRRQKNWAASQPDRHQYDYLRDEVGTLVVVARLPSTVVFEPQLVPNAHGKVLLFCVSVPHH